MGAYLSSPITEKETFDGTGRGVRFGGCGMQGWRRTMEDAHLAETAVGAEGAGAGEPAQLFGVFDGHGGSEVAKFCQIHMAQELEQLEAFKTGSNDRALEDVFHRMDEMLRDGKYSQQVQSLKCKSADDEEPDEDGEGARPSALTAFPITLFCVAPLFAFVISSKTNSFTTHSTRWALWCCSPALPEIILL